jgi:cell division protein FtsZ
MSIDFIRPEVDELRPRISVIGVGGAGGNAIANMIAPTSRASTSSSPIPTPRRSTRRRPTAHPARPQDHPGPRRRLAAGDRQGRRRGGDRGDRGGARRRAHVLHRRRHGRRHRHRRRAGHRQGARDKGILTVGVVTKPFSFEGNRRGRSAEAGIEELQQHVDTLIVIPNQNLFRIANPNTTFKEAFEDGRRGAPAGRPRDHRPDGHARPHQPRLRRRPLGDGRDGQGDDGHRRGDGDNRAIEAAEKAIANPLLDGVSDEGRQAA